ncbi:hypothetical protein AB6A40_009293 [Gnathostoma spinigerum]|uniref:Uncharacterized protein n=1 Tax=Gnathostoma spinigerum TaxID=75299 RepID=A0ABD6EWP3_9BILA
MRFYVQVFEENIVTVCDETATVEELAKEAIAKFAKLYSTASPPEIQNQCYEDVRLVNADALLDPHDQVGHVLRDGDSIIIRRKHESVNDEKNGSLQNGRFCHDESNQIYHVM